ncbi:unnamed protein product [Spirodela intermedia]|uniref:Uncharacterized protein n=1 Tax=Spirodela intermedia TaxID=51605 RepID=A0A7I8I971_SPIIN|nr:unnamed protein product [Spirodela intermedia]CAA6653461.1 unnamed protein product [Spirodela intermedia]
MEGAEEVGLVLARASELRSKIDRCILENAAERRLSDGDALGLLSPVEGGREEEEENDEDDAEQEEESLIDVRDALESLEQQLSSLQALEQRQIYEKEAALAQIDRCRMFLLSRIREYKGDSEVVQEASIFAGGNTEEDGDLLLPPYSSHIPEAFILGGLSSSLHLPNGLGKRPLSRVEDKLGESSMKQADSLAGSAFRRAGLFFRLAAKSAVATVGVLAILRLAGFEPRLTRRCEAEEAVATTRCPPGRVLVVEDGVVRCVVKERVEVPFGSVDPAPVVSLGLG